MEGVEILSTTEVVAEYIYNYWLTGFVWIGVVIVCGIVGYIIADYGDKFVATLIGFLIGALVGLFAYLMFMLGTSKPIAYETQYKVTVSDEVSMNEFLDKYEILDQEGKIYTVRERD